MTDTDKPTYLELAQLVEAFLVPDRKSIENANVNRYIEVMLHLLAIQVLRKNLDHDGTELFRHMINRNPATPWPSRESFFYYNAMFATDGKPFDELDGLARLAEVKRSVVELALEGIRARAPKAITHQFDPLAE